MSRSKGELTGLEWEAEKAYIVATSPRSTSQSSMRNSEDDFTFEVVQIRESDESFAEERLLSKNSKDEGSKETADSTCTSWEEQTVTIKMEAPSDEESDGGEQDAQIPQQSPQTNEPIALKDTKPEENENKASKDTKPEENENIPSKDTTPEENENKASKDTKPEESENTPMKDTKLEKKEKTLPSHLENNAEAAEPPPALNGLSENGPRRSKDEQTVTTSLSHNSLQNRAAAMDTAKKPVVQSDSQILVTYGPSGHGKGVLIQKLVYRSPQQFSMVVSHTTRQQRVDEMYARDFFFVSKADMVKKIRQNAFMEYVQIDSLDQPIQTNRDYAHQNKPRASVVSLSSTVGELYGTTWESFEEALLSNKPCIVLNISTKGAEQIQALGISATYMLLHPGKEPKDCGTIAPDYSISLENKEEAFGLLEEYALGLACREPVFKSPKHMEKALEEWERVPNIQLLDEKHQAGAKTRKHQLSHKFTSFGELLNHFQNANLKEQLMKIKPEIQGSALTKMLGPPKMNKRLRDERNMVFAIALCKFDDTNNLHTRALSMIYRRLTGVGTISRFGTHWEEIGFQGSDPIDDLRGVGFLGLMQLIWLLETPLVQLLTLEVFQYSKHHGQQPPFCVLILNITCIALQALREGCLTRECNRRDQVFAVINEFTAAVLLSFFHTWQRQQKGPMEVGMVLQDVGGFAKRHPKFLLRELKIYLGELERDELVSSTKSDRSIEEYQVEFTKIEIKETTAV